VDEATTELARRLAAHERWEWRRGMEAESKGGVVWPDLTDDATAGVLLGMLTWGDCYTVARTDGCVWAVMVAQGAKRLADTTDVHLGVAVARALLEVWDG
jgi:hypothetical protein